jgi:hypothetical protein
MVLLPLAAGRPLRSTTGPIHIDAAILLAAMLAAHLFVAASVALYSFFPSSYDEIAHISFTKAMAEAPVLFPHYGDYFLLDPKDLSVWTREPNYLAHPSLYYLFMAPIWTLSSGNVLALRLTDVALSSIGLALTATAGAKLITAPRTRLLFILLVFCFPKTPIIGGIVSNDNFVLIAAGLFFWGCANQKHRILFLSLALILAGWTKLTALVGLGAAAGFLVLYSTVKDHKPLFQRGHILLAFALLLGSLPYAVNWLRTGHLLYVPENSFWILPLDQREDLNILTFAPVFFGRIIDKFPAADKMMDDALPLAALILIAFVALRSKGEDKAHRLTMSFLVALIVFVPIHFSYAWQTFLSAGQTIDAQPRYYNELWPGFALALALACATIDQKRWPFATIAVVILCLLPTAAGLLIFTPPMS